MRWKIIVAAACIIVVGSFALLFRGALDGPSLLSIPFVLWSSVVSTAVLVWLTYLGARSFPFKDEA